MQKAGEGILPAAVADGDDVVFIEREKIEWRFGRTVEKAWLNRASHKIGFPVATIASTPCHWPIAKSA